VVRRIKTEATIFRRRCRSSQIVVSAGTKWGRNGGRLDPAMLELLQTGDRRYRGSSFDEYSYWQMYNRGSVSSCMESAKYVIDRNVDCFGNTPLNRAPGRLRIRGIVATADTTGTSHES